MAEKRDKMIECHLNKRVEVGDTVIVANGLLDKYCKDPNRNVSVRVKEVFEDGSIVVYNSQNYRDDVIHEGEYKLDTFKIGADPFAEKSWRTGMRTYNYDIACILNKFGVHVWRNGAEVKDEPYQSFGDVKVNEVDFNPYVIDRDGNKWHYQREWCWSLEQKQLFIESIYQSINCGMIIVRERGFDWVDKQIEDGDSEVGFSDIVDGKQRIGALIDFVLDKYTDLHGNYFSDLSECAKVKFCNSRVLTYGELGENTTDEDTISAFLGINYTGVPMSKEHIDYVKEIQSKFSAK